MHCDLAIYVTICNKIAKKINKNRKRKKILFVVSELSLCMNMDALRAYAAQSDPREEQKRQRTAAA